MTTWEWIAAIVVYEFCRAMIAAFCRGFVRGVKSNIDRQRKAK